MSTVALGPAYRKLWVSTALTNVGDGIRMAAFPLLAVALTGRPELVAGVAVAAALPWLLVGLTAGAVVDRVDRRRLLVTVDFARVLLLALLVLLIVADMATIWTLYIVAFVGGLGETLRDTASSTMVPTLVPAEGWVRANGRLATAEIVGNELVGPALGGWLFAVAVALPFAVNGGALAVAVLLVLSLPDVFRPVPPDPVPVPGTPGAARASLRADVAAGLRWLARHPLLRAVTVLVMLVALVDAAWFAVLVLYAQQVAGISAAGYGLFLATGALGGVLGGLSADRLIRRVGAPTALTGGVILTGTAQLVLGLTDRVPVMAAALAASGLAFALANVAVVSLRQRCTPAGMLGRVTATYRTLATGAAALGALLGGVIAAGFGVRAAMIAGAPVLVLAGLLAAPVLRRAGR